MDKGLEKNITIADVAEALGVSKTTVSRAISGKGRIGRETRERVLAYIEEHDYKPNVIAKGLAQSKTYNICVVMPGEYDVVDLTFFQECLFGIQEIAGSMEYDILLSICRKNDISSLERIIANHKVDGVILMRTFVEDEQIDFLQTKNVPFVTIGSSVFSVRCPIPGLMTGHPSSHSTFARKVSLPILQCPSHGLDASMTTYQFPSASSTRSPCPA